MLANHVFLLQPSVPWLSIVTFHNDAKPPPKWIWCITNPIPARRVTRLYCSTDLDVRNYVSFVSHDRTRLSNSFNLRTPFCKTSSFQASYFNRIVKLWNYVCKLAPPTSFSSPTAFQLFVRKLMSTHLSRVYEINYPCTWTLVPTCPCHS